MGGSLRTNLLKKGAVWRPFFCASFKSMPEHLKLGTANRPGGRLQLVEVRARCQTFNGKRLQVSSCWSIRM